MAKLQTKRERLRPSVRVKVRTPEKKAQPFYLSPEWRSLMEAIIAKRFGGRDKARCEDPECTKPYRRGIRVFGDHIVEIKDGGALLDERNILCRCGSCHTRKTGEARAMRYGLTP